MLSQKSIRESFILQLVSASATLIVIFSVILYNYIKISIFEDITQELTKQAKIIYDFWKDIKNFTEKQLPKHINREKWLSNNLSVVSQRINKDVSGFKVKSIIVSSSVLPVKFVEVYKDITFTTLSQLVLENIF